MDLCNQARIYQLDQSVARKKAEVRRLEDNTKGTMMMIDDGVDRGDVHGDQLWSNVEYPHFDVFLPRKRFAPGLVP